jgi:protein-tyrosine-phosphatase
VTPPRSRGRHAVAPAGGGAVPDPYYGGEDGFEEVLTMAERTADALADELRAVVTA